MRAIVQPNGHGDLDSMQLSQEEPVPSPGDGQLLVKVHTAALNRMDLLQRKGTYPVPADASPILGVEVAGTVEAVGPATAGRFQVGDRVMSLLQAGANPNLGDEQFQHTALHLAVCSLYPAVEVCQFLIEAKADILQQAMAER